MMDAVNKNSLSLEGLYYTLRAIRIDDSVATALTKSGIDHLEENEKLKEIKLLLLKSQVLAEGYLMVKQRYFFDIYDNDGYVNYPRHFSIKKTNVHAYISKYILAYETLTINCIHQIEFNDPAEVDNFSIEIIRLPKIFGSHIKLATPIFCNSKIPLKSQKSYKESFRIYSQIN